MKVAVLGFGTVGQGVWEMLGAARDLEQGCVLVRPGKDDAAFKRTSLEEVLADESIGAVAEAMGGVDPAYSYAAAALCAGKHVVTSNKALVAERGIELAALARERGLAFLFSAACGGAVPFLHNLYLARQSDEILSLGGILNGTTNYMLDAMQRRGLSYREALSEAQGLGYAEADPTADVSGLDALRKIMLGCAVAYDMLPAEGLRCEGIENLTAEDVADFQKRSLVCRLLGGGGRAEDGVYAWVQPVLLSAAAPESAVRDNYNFARYEGKNSGAILLQGQGAGRYPTASAVLRDLTVIRAGTREMLGAACARQRAQNALARERYYIRLPETLAGRFAWSERACAAGVVRGVTVPMSVETMFLAAEALRQEGAELFFAAVRGAGIC